jgi:nucleoside-diphosphate-sugar epimerase
MKKIGIIGCGWLGSRLAEKLSERFEIYTTTTTSDKSENFISKGFNPTIISFMDYQLSKKIMQWEVASDLDVLIITVPLSEKSCCISSLFNRVQNLSSFIGNFKGQLFLMSSTGVYPDSIKEFTEDDLSLENVSGERMIKGIYPQVNILRLAGLMGDERLLCNYDVSNLDLSVNHIHYADISSVIEKMIEQQLQSKIYNVVAPLHPSKAEVINTQKNIPFSNECEPKGRIISSSKLVSELDFVFKYPDPRYFHL